MNTSQLIPYAMNATTHRMEAGEFQGVEGSSEKGKLESAAPYNNPNVRPPQIVSTTAKRISDLGTERGQQGDKRGLAKGGFSTSRSHHS